MQPVPDLAPEPEPEPQPELELERAVRHRITVEVGHQQAITGAQELTGVKVAMNAVRDEERTFLLMYLREFAGPDGLLPDDFDSLVRDSFGDLVGAR